MGVDPARLQGGSLAVQSPIDGAVVARLREHTADETAQAIGRAQAAFLAWRNVPAPRRGELIRLLGDELRANKQALGRVVSLEAGQILAEGEGDFQEKIIICAFDLGIDLPLYGLAFARETPR